MGSSLDKYKSVYIVFIWDTLSTSKLTRIHAPVIKACLLWPYYGGNITCDVRFRPRLCENPNFYII